MKREASAVEAILQMRPSRGLKSRVACDSDFPMRIVMQEIESDHRKRSPGCQRLNDSSQLTD